MLIVIIIVIIPYIRIQYGYLIVLKQYIYTYIWQQPISVVYTLQVMMSENSQSKRPIITIRRHILSKGMIKKAF